MKFLILLAVFVGLAPLRAAEVFGWKQSEGAVALTKSNQVVWQFNYKKSEAKPYFHPISLADGTVITDAKPADHPWHRGLWFSWKYINGVNYWEENKTGRSEGETEVVKLHITTNADFSAKIEMTLSYHPRGKASVLSEQRVITVSRPDEKGDFVIDHFSQCLANSENLVFDRTPPKNGSGGYGGFSVRLGAQMKSWTFSSSDGKTGAAANYGKTAQWLDFSGPKGGITVFDHPKNPRYPTAWYPNQSMPWFTPALLFNAPYELKAGQELTLKYRVYIHSGGVQANSLEKLRRDFAP